jgi:drug/metabolite transporter (DMT)-like permease
VALFVNQVIKACGPCVSAVFEFLLLGKTHPVTIYLSVLCIVMGSAVSNIANFGQGETSLLGVVVCMISLGAASLKPVLQKIITSGGNSRLAGPKPLEPAQAIVWDSGIAFILFMVVWLVSGERQASIDYILSHTKNPKSGLLAMGIIAFGSCMAFSFNIANYYYIHYTSALTSTVGSNGIKIFLICITAFTDGYEDTTTILGIAIVVLAIITYAYLSFQEKNKKPAIIADVKADAANAADEKAAPLAPSETTPLTQPPEKTSVFSSFPLVAVGICAACVAIIFAAVAIPMVIMHKDEEVFEANATNATIW